MSCFALLSIADLHVHQDSTSKETRHQYSYPRPVIYPQLRKIFEEILRDWG